MASINSRRHIGLGGLISEAGSLVSTVAEMKQVTAGDQTDLDGANALRLPRNSSTSSLSSLVDTVPTLPESIPPSSLPPPPPVPMPRFPILPPVQTSEGQVTQSVPQVHSILSLPPTLLAQLARTTDPDEQREIAAKKGAVKYLDSMVLPPPDPTVLVGPRQVASATTAAKDDLVSTVPKRTVDTAIEQLINHVLGPTEDSIPAIYTIEGSQIVPPTSIHPPARYGSLDDWSFSTAESYKAVSEESENANETVQLSDQEVESLAAELKSWALEQHENTVQHLVLKAKQDAVLLAAKTAVQKDVVEAVGIAVKNDPEKAHQIQPGVVATNLTQKMDLSGYSERFKVQLENLASGYYATLHKEIVRKLEQEQTGSSSTMTEDSKQIQASAVAALTATLVAATDVQKRASLALHQMGIPPTAVASTLPTTIPPQPSGSAYTPSPTQPAQQRVQPPPPKPDIPAEQSMRAVLETVQKEGRCTEKTRDYLLSAAHVLYIRAPKDDYLLGLLHTVTDLHPTHLPSLLLLSCVYYSRGDLVGSVAQNAKILEIDPNYVEAMSNLGTTYRAMGRTAEAETWWRRAVGIRPSYFDAFDNLLGVLCNPNPQKPQEGPRYREALELCEQVERGIYVNGFDDTNGQIPLRPLVLPSFIPIDHVHRLQNLFYAKGNLQSALGNPLAAQDEYIKAVEIALSTPVRRLSEVTSRPNIKDLILGSTALGFVLMRGIQGMDWKSKQEFGTQSVHTALDLLGVKEYILRQGQAGQNPTFLKAAEQFSSGLYTRLHQLGNGNLPTILLPPQVLDRFVKMLFGGCLPVLLGLNNPSVPPETRAQTMASVNSTTSTILLTLAKLFQDASTSPNGPMAQAIRASGFQPSVPLLLSIFYSAISIHDSPSTANNLGILLSTIPSQPQPGQIPGTPAPSGQALALEFYRFGLSKDPNHPHLYTNYGSLLKDMGHIALAVEEYKKAVACQPNFAVALANLANAIKDMGRVQESIEYYRRAVEIEPNFPEAVCGLVNALGGVCDWNGRGSVGDDPVVTEDGKLLPVPVPDVNGKYPASGWMGRIVTLVDRQLEEGKKFGRGILKANNNLEYWMDFVAWIMTGERKSAALGRHEEIWKKSLQVFLSGGLHPYNEGGFLVRLVELGMRRTQHRWYRDSYGKALNAFPGMQLNNDTTAYQRPTLPSNLPGPAVPTVLPFHTFTYPLSARQVRLISHRNALKISYSTLMQPWMPRTVFPPPPPPTKLNIGYVSSDLNNHPLAHLMQSVFGFHDQSRFNVFCYATTPSDNSAYRIKIEREVPRFLDVSTWSTDQIVNRIAQDGIHILINLNGYTKGARNEVFAARPAPLQMEFMGFAGPLSGGWCDYVVADAIVCPPETAAAEEWRRRKDQGLPESPADLPGDIDPEEASDSWVYNEKFIYMPDSYFVCDHAQSSRDALSTLPPDQRWSVEEDLRWRKRRELFPGLRDDVVIFANFNQLYKIDPAIFQSWLKILRDVPNSILWLLRFPAAGEPHLLQTASLWAGLEVAGRIRFTDVTSKDEHIARGRVVDLFLDTTECNAHTTACDILWSGTPMITYPRREWKMCSRVAASIVSATGYGSQMTVYSFEEYERRAVALASSLRYQYTSEIMDGLVVSHRRGQGELIELRKNLFLSRETSPLFDTRRWTRNLEKGYIAAWKRWVDGTEFEESPDWENETEIGRSGSIWIQNN